MNKNTIRKAAIASFMAAACLMPLTACGGANNGTTASPVVVDNGQSYQLIDSVSALPQKPVAEGVHYFAYDAEAGTNSFGPAEALSSAQDGAEKFAGRLVADPLLLATVIAFDQYGEGLDPAVVHTNADGYAINKANRVADTQTFINNVTGVKLIDMGTTRYDSLGMIPGANRNVRPTLTKFSEQPEMHQVLVLTMKSGKQIFLRVACGFQPSVPKFTKIVPPKVKEKPAKPVVCPEGTKFAGKPVPKNGACDIPPTTPSTKSTPPTTTPPTTTPPTTTPPTTTPPTTTPPTTTPPTTTPPTTTPPESKKPTQIPGNGGEGDGGTGQYGGGGAPSLTESATPPKGGNPPVETYTPPAPPVVTTSQAPVVTQSPDPVPTQASEAPPVVTTTTVAPSTQPNKTGKIVPTPGGDF